MSNVLFISDLHLGHRKILDFASQPEVTALGGYRGGTTIDEHDDWVIERLMSVDPNKNTTWWILGDVAMDREKLRLLDQVPGRKNLIMGNHDNFKTEVYLEHFQLVRGPIKKYGMWLSHIPLREDDLFGCPNIHGHQHYWPLRNDERYFNMCIEFTVANTPISLEELRFAWLPGAEAACLTPTT